MSDTQDPMEVMKQRMAEHAKVFASQLPERYHAIAGALAQYLSSPTVENLDEASRLAHSLAGAAAIFGFPRVGERAKQLELALYAVKQQQPHDDVQELLEQLHHLIQSPA
jgi:HPt (histidine-containing phosphotransfer) domain-containing protein